MRLFSVVFLLFVLPSLSLADCANRVNSIKSIGDVKSAFRCLNNEIRVLKQKLKKGGAGSVVVNQIPGSQPTINQTTTEREIKYDLLGCGNKRGKVECELRVTSLGADRKIQISTYTKLYDEKGNEHQTSYIQIANSSASHGYDIIKTLISNIPTKMILRFNGVSSQATLITVLNINEYYSKNGISFRNIALKR